uniref:Uncharacterized protein n=1 Tax=Timema tahoe TaxID=61484 RepID=A0A7R9IPS3_9NEOP|nr:unnamed protein product [Timema tahoe]
MVEIKKAEPRDSNKMGDGLPNWGPPQGGPPMGMGGAMVLHRVLEDTKVGAHPLDHRASRCHHLSGAPTMVDHHNSKDMALMITLTRSFGSPQAIEYPLLRLLQNKDDDCLQ